MLEDGFSYPLRGEWVGRTIIGGILGYFSVLILPAIILYGYFVEVLRTTARGRDEAPEFDDWGEMIKDGVIGLVISIVYAIIPFGIVGIISTVFLGGGAALGGDGGGALAGLGFLTLLLLIPLVFVIYYIVPAAITAYATEDKISAAFSFSILKPILLNGSYFIAVLTPVLVAVVIWIATTVLAITVIGLLLVPFLQFYGQVAIFRMFGLAYRDVATGSATSTI
ncbi:hypothetical protein DM826_05075 [Halonotius aquaticus]|uniref:DUF4013 domain-containing protein n=1 Tax=Halonotius aquaticus TaxID=2216978 RepID=A0A3A6QCA7_9EURY|nr:DUF4013 domain-containing protein [Halonotius aquaticus]RJX43625.1 hypothetical protein DM826_05075 [Halonotius aquaticus]